LQKIQGINMTTERSSKYFGLTALLLTTVTLAGCSSYGGGAAGSGLQITINSDPQGATVLANGDEIGVTPLTINPGNHYRASFTSGGSSGGIVVFRYVGTLAVKKPGCKDYSTQVNDYILSKDIDVKLECDPAYRPVAAQPVTPAPAAVPAAVATPATPVKQPDLAGGDAKERLLRIESLYEEGLLSDDEYLSLRKRVMDGL
jgi:hypothetical protein